MMQRIGIDIGTSSIKLIVLDQEKMACQQLRCHNGAVQETLLQMLQEMQPEIKQGPVFLGVTGQGAESMQKLIPQIERIEEIPAVTCGIQQIAPEAKSIIDIGCQNARYITGISGRVPQFAMNEHCAGGTGSFFEAQMSRLGLDMHQYSDLVAQAETIPNMSGRCAVFAKSDMIHRQQEQVPVADIMLGLCYAMVRNFKAVVMGRLPVEKPVALCGGVAENQGVVRALKDILQLNEEELLIPDSFRYAGAIGAAVLTEQMIDCMELSDVMQKRDGSAADSSGRLSRLPAEQQAAMDAEPWPATLPEDGCYLGIDIGSTSTNLVLVDRTRKLLAYQYLRTGGNPMQAVETGLHALKQRYGDNLPVLAVGVTGSGRERIGKMLKADVVRDEITAQARAAVYASPEADTVFEIGGQDSKYISLKGGQIDQFQMNKICAAGTGAFIEEQASSMGVAIEAFGPLALTAEQPVELGDRCTVFIESAIASATAQGASRAEVAAGLCHSIVQNYLNKVVGNRPVGQHIVLQGGVAYNPGIVAAFRHRYGERLHVSPVFAVSGAFGVALLAAEATGDREKIRPVALDETELAVQKPYRVKQEKSLLLKDYEPICHPDKKTVGVPYALMIHKFFPMANAFFKELGFNVLLSSATSEKTIALAQQLARSETCYPVKLIYGHMQELAEQHVDYIFMPSVRTMKHETSKVANNYGCVYMQTAPKLIYDAMQLEKQGITLLNPVFDLDFGQQAMAVSMVALGESLGFSKPRCMKALLSGAMAVRKHTAMVEKQGQMMLEQLKSSEKMLVIITRNYGIADPVLNMGIPQLLQERGYKVLTLSHLPAHDLDLSADHPDLCWPFGQHILSGAKIIKNHPNLYAVYLTNHGCGPDTMLSHLFREEMGDKPYLHIEVVEHFSRIGVITRIEAFLNSLEQRPACALPENFNLKQVSTTQLQISGNIQKEPTLLIPDIGVYGKLLAHYYAAQQIKTELIPAGQAEMNLGLTETSSKEYAAFTLLLGTALQAARKFTDAQLLLPHTEGAEADNQYGRVTDAILRKNGLALPVYSPCLEQLPQTAQDFSALFHTLLAGDVYYALPPAMRDQVVFEKIPSVAELMQLAEQAGTMQNDTTPYLAAVGDPICLFGIASPILQRLEQDGYQLHRMPVTEYLLYLWKKTVDPKKTEQILQQCQDTLLKFSRALGSRSPFSDTLFAKADANGPMGRFAGGNGSYRFEKLLQEKGRASGVLSIAPQYENTEIILGMQTQLADIPIYHMEIGNRWENSDWERLRSFLYYTK